MLINLVVVGAVLLVAYLWSTKGFFSSFLNMVSVLAAGGVAFALWEPVAMGLMNAMGTTPIVADNAWAIGLGGTFAVTLAIGLMLSLFTALTCTRTLLRLLMGYTGLRRLPYFLPASQLPASSS